MISAAAAQGPLKGWRRACCLAALLVAAPAFAETVSVEARPFSQFRVGSDQTRFGKLEFLGGLVLSSREALFGSLSSIRFREDGAQFIAVLDTGHWLTGRVLREPGGRLAGLADVEINSMKDFRGRGDSQKYNMDSEGLAFRGDTYLVSFERKHRVDVYPAGRPPTAAPVGSLPILIPKSALRGNGGLETIVTAPAGSPLDGAAVVIAERIGDSSGNLLAAILDGPQKGLFGVRVSDGFAVSDGAFLPSGDLLLLERRFNVASGVSFRILRFKGDAIRKGAVIDGELLLEADMADQIDNMEGIDVVRDEDGRLRLVLVSDDNHSIFQRNLMLEFRLVE